MKISKSLVISKITFHDEHDSYGYVCKSNPNVHNTPMHLFMKVWAHDIDGNDYFFKTPALKYKKKEGLMCGKYFTSKSDWYKIEEKTPTGHKGANMFDGGSTANFCIELKDTATPVINIGDCIEIQANQTGTGKPNNIYAKGLIFLNRVKLLKIN